ncbi:hypothetical protein HMPREF3212_04855 [Citrobacter freundii]|nr:hypothetical protein HMPREF3212_04855 [Citrobacter freundii]
MPSLCYSHLYCMPSYRFWDDKIKKESYCSPVISFIFSVTA